MKSKLTYGLGLILILVFMSVSALAYNEAPMLQEQVDQGNLPPVDERLPEDPMVVEPINNVGTYGGTWNRFSTAEDFLFMAMTLDGPKLVKFSDEDLQPKPNIVKDWEVNEDKSEWIFEFRKGIKWSDGEPLTVDDFLFWWEDMVLDEEQALSPFAWTRINGELMEVSKINDYEVKVSFAGPNPFLLENMAMWSSLEAGTQLYPEHYLKQFHPQYTDEYDNYEVFNSKYLWWENSEIPVLNSWRPVKRSAGDEMILERNPYYFAVDTEGNQLPYIDNMEVKYLSDNEVFKMQLSQGKSDMQIRPGVLGVRDISLLKRREEDSNFSTVIWDSGSGTGPLFMPNRNFPEEEKQELYRDPNFLRALSHAIDRDKIKRSVFYDQGYITTGTYSAKTPFFQTEIGQEMYEKWKNLAIEYDVEKAKDLLDKAGVTDQDGDGWREYPSGKDLTLRIDIDSETDDYNMDTTEYTKEFWEEIGLETIINTMSGAKLWMNRVNAEFDIMGGWEASDGIGLVAQPGWIAPVDPDHHWAPLYDNWYLEEGTTDQSEPIDTPARELSPPRERPEVGSPMDRLQKIYDKAKSIPSTEERESLVADMIQVHLDHGPFIIGTVGGYPRIGVKSDNMKNVPEKLNSGWVNDWHLSYIATLNPEQFYLEE